MVHCDWKPSLSVEDGPITACEIVVITCEVVVMTVGEKKLGEAEAIVMVEVIDPMPLASIVTVGKPKPLQVFPNAKRMVGSIFTKIGNCGKDALVTRFLQRKNAS